MTENTCGSQSLNIYYLTLYRKLTKLYFVVPRHWEVETTGHYSEMLLSHQINWGKKLLLNQLKMS